jgi:transposase
MSQRYLLIPLSRTELFAIKTFISDMAAKRNNRARIRGQIVWLSHQNYIPERIAEYLKCPLYSVYHWLRVYRRKGIKGLYDKPRPTKLTQAQMEQIFRISRWQNPVNNPGDARLRWTFRKIAQWVKDNFKISISHERIRQIIKNRKHPVE